MILPLPARSTTSLRLTNNPLARTNPWIGAFSTTRTSSSSNVVPTGFLHSLAAREQVPQEKIQQKVSFEQRRTMMTTARIRVSTFGGPEQLEFVNENNPSG